MKLTDRFRSHLLLSRRGQPKPTNRNFNVIAQKAIDTFASVTAEKSSNAVKVDGWPAYVHLYRFGSEVCTCKRQDQFMAEPVEDFVADNAGSPRVVDRPNSGPVTSFVLRGDFAETAGGAVLRPDLQTQDVNPANEMLFDTDVDVFDAESVDIATTLAGYSTLDDKPCGVCGATGFIDTYMWASGARLLLLPNAAIDLSDAEVNTGTRPHSLDVTTGGEVIWEVEIPAYFEAVELWRVKDNTEKVKEVRLFTQLPGGVWTALDYDVFDYLKGTGGKVKFKAQAQSDCADDIIMFTHAEIYIRTVPLPYCQFPQLDRDVTGATLESLLNTSFEIDPRIGPISRRTIIEIPRMGRMWFVTSLSGKQTANGFVFNVSGQAQVVQPNMPVYALAMQARWQGLNLRGHSNVQISAPNRKLALPPTPGGSRA